MSISLLILTDFFQAANRALDYATTLAVPLHARLVLLHVRRDSLLDPELLTDQLATQSQEAIDLALHRVTADLPVPVLAEVGHGRVADAVAEAVGRHHPALIVLGRPDESDIPLELVQTTSLDILRTAPYPMLVVPHQVAHATPPRRVLLAVDGDEFTLGEHAGASHQLLAALHAELTMLTVRADTADTASTALESVQRTGLTLGLPAVHSLIVHDASPARGILHAARPADFDLVVLIARRRSFLSELFHRSVTAQVLLGSEIPVLVLPAQ